MADNFSHIRAAAIDERCHNVFYRQTQLERLSKALIDKSSDIRQAIATDYGYTPAEVAIELHLALGAVKRDYASLQPKEAHEEEYLIAVGKDAKSIRKPAGIVYIEPCKHTLFYSVVVPLSAAIAAGNCVIVLVSSVFMYSDQAYANQMLQLENNLRALSGVLRQILPAALDRETFAIASSSVKDQSLLDSAIHVNQNSDERSPRANQLASSSRSRTVAVIDRTADVQLAARELVAARFGFGGRSPYAPDLVLVNEFSKQAFLQAVVSECVKKGEVRGKTATSGNVNKEIDILKKADSGLRVILQEPSMAVVDLPSRKHDRLTEKMDAPILAVHAIRSLDDAIDLISQASTGPYLAAYHFSNPATGKYLTQFVDARISFVNNIPRDILIGPAFPESHQINPAVRYSVESFSVARPAFIQSPRSATLFDTALASTSNAAVTKLLVEATTPLSVKKRSPGGGVGYFEQGFLYGAAILLGTIVSVSGVGIYYFAKHGRRWW